MATFWTAPNLSKCALNTASPETIGGKSKDCTRQKRTKYNSISMLQLVSIAKTPI